MFQYPRREPGLHEHPGKQKLSESVQCPGLELFLTQVPGIFLSVHQGQLQEQAVQQHCLQAQQVGLQEAVLLGNGQF